MDTTGTQLRPTPLRSEHLAAGAKLVPFAGWEMPLDYGSILAEARVVRSGAGVFDVSHMGRFRFRGPRVAEELDHALGCRILDQGIGQARYSLLLAPDGGILDDLITYRLAEDEFFMVVNAANRDRDAATLRERLAETPLEDLSLDGGGILAIQGPDSHRILAELSGQEDFCPRFLDLAWLDSSEFGRILCARTGYTGEHGYEVFAEPTQIRPLWERMLALGASPVGLGARDVLRLEAALPLYGHEIHESVNPFEAGLRFGVRGWKTRDFIGGEALRALPEPRRELIGLLAEKRTPREGYTLLCNGREAGVVCSGVWSAALDRPIATAYLEIGADGPLSVRARGREFPVVRTPLPFVPHHSRD